MNSQIILNFTDNSKISELRIKVIIKYHFAFRLQFNEVLLRAPNRNQLLVIAH